MFTFLEGVTYLGTYPSGNVGRDFTDPTDFEFTEELRAVHEMLLGESFGEAEASEVRSFFSNLPAETCIWSNERATSTFFSPLTVQEKILRLQRVVDECAILVVIRAQHRQLISQYRDQPFEPSVGLSGKAVNPATWLDQLFAKDGEIGYLESLDFHHLWEFLETTFKGRVTMLPLEGIRKDKQKFSRELGQCLGQDSETIERLLDKPSQNLGVTAKRNYVRKLTRNHRMASRVNNVLNRSPLAKSYNRFLDQGQTANYDFPSSGMERLKDRFGESNRRLSEIIGWDLAGMGYL
ncbi:MAG: hypothetical protein Q7Q71_00790 [Verrucomicrobiota bacterium JB023]|nr:hypothetical protein [Verrucomicrobiota bacterium JB023]